MAGLAQVRRRALELKVGQPLYLKMKPRPRGLESFYEAYLRLSVLVQSPGAAPGTYSIGHS